MQRSGMMRQEQRNKDPDNKRVQEWKQVFVVSTGLKASHKAAADQQ